MMLIMVEIVIIVCVYILWRYRNKEELKWTALSAAATFFAVIIALFLPIHQEWSARPKLEICMPEYSNNFIRWGDTQDGNYRFYYVDIELKNNGSSIARGCQPFLTAVYKKDRNRWEKTKNWVPIGLEWILTTGNQQFNPYPEMRDLAPKRSFIFSLGNVHKLEPDLFVLARHLIPTGQPDKFRPGEYCFEITVYSSNTNSVIKYFNVNWKGGYAQEGVRQFQDEQDFIKKLVVSELKKAPINT